MRYIDAEKLANDIYRAWELWEKKGEDCYLFADVITPMLVGQPTADVQPVVKGEWIEDGEGEIYCSKCGKYTYDRHDEIKEFDGKTVIALCYPRFCGNCGAMMSQECNT